MIGFSSVMYTNPADSVTVALYLNSDPVYHDITTNDFVVAILNEIYRPSSKVNDLSALASGPVTVSPNPATDHATFSFTIPKGEAVRLVVYDERGSEVRTLNGSLLEAGAHNLTLDATSLADGNYIYCLQTPEGSTCGKLAIVR
jgi:hypothetical protein